MLVLLRFINMQLRLKAIVGVSKQGEAMTDYSVFYWGYLYPSTFAAVIYIVQGALILLGKESLLPNTPEVRQRIIVLNILKANTKMPKPLFVMAVFISAVIHGGLWFYKLIGMLAGKRGV